MENYKLKDIFTQSLILVDFIADYCKILNTKELENKGLFDFYNGFCKKYDIKQKNGSNILFTPALILGHLYVSFLLPQQKFYNNMPSDIYVDEKWGLQVIKGDRNDNLKNVSRRIRNSLSHNHFYIDKNFNFVFWDAKNLANDVKDADVIYRLSYNDMIEKFLPNWVKFLIEKLADD